MASISLPQEAFVGQPGNLTETVSSFAGHLYQRAVEYLGSPDPRDHWLGIKIAEMAETASYLKADGPESYNDRLQTQMAWFAEKGGVL